VDKTYPPEFFTSSSNNLPTYSPTVIASAITSQINKAKLPTHIELSAKEYGLPKDSVVLLEQIRTIDKKRLREKIGHLDDELMERLMKHFQ